MPNGHSSCYVPFQQHIHTFPLCPLLSNFSSLLLSPIFFSSSLFPLFPSLPSPKPCTSRVHPQLNIPAPVHQSQHHSVPKKKKKHRLGISETDFWQRSNTLKNIRSFAPKKEKKRLARNPDREGEKILRFVAAVRCGGGGECVYVMWVDMEDGCMDGEWETNESNWVGS